MKVPETIFGDIFISSLPQRDINLPGMEIATRLFIFSALYLLVLETEETIPKGNGNHIINKCTKCPPGWGVVKRCTRTTDTLCKNCTRGKSYSSHRSSKSPCWSCSKCGVGLYESHGCSPVRDTICNECVSYLDHKNIASNKDFLKKCTYILL